MNMKKIKEAEFGNIPVSIYQVPDGYLLEYSDDEGTHTCHCDEGGMFWEAMSDATGDTQAPDPFAIIDLLDTIESRVDIATEDELAVLAQSAIDECPELMPAYVLDEMMAALKQRLYKVEAGYTHLHDVSIDQFMCHAIESGMIFRVQNQSLSEPYVRIKQLIHSGEDIYLYITLVSIEYDDNDCAFWYEDASRLVKLRDTVLMHHKLDELPASYTGAD